MAFHRKGPKYTFGVTNVTFREAGVEVRQHQVVAFSPERTEVYISRYKLAFCRGSKVKVTHNVRGRISPERPKMHIRSCKLVTFCGVGLEIRQNLRVGISPGEGAEMYILSDNLTLCRGSRVKVTHNVPGRISLERPKMLI